MTRDLLAHHLFDDQVTESLGVGSIQNVITITWDLGVNGDFRIFPF